MFKLIFYLLSTGRAFLGKIVITVIVLKLKKIKNTLSCIIPITYLIKYEPNRSTLKNQLEHASSRAVLAVQHNCNSQIMLHETALI